METYDKEYCYIIDKGLNVYIVKERAINKCFEEIISPLDIVSQIGNDTEMEMIQQLESNYVRQLENGLINALDRLSKLDKNFDYYETLRELTDFGNYQALDFLDMFGDNEEERVCKIVKGQFVENENVIVNINDNILKRRVYFDTMAKDLYVVFKHKKYYYREFTLGENYEK